ncbi:MULTISPECIES: hypothetical protein [unclassified Legionella]|uniref:hypothetical protein n=1 Tax=unclassified Legionella TaxID=2622702 RepID=UPI0010559051|nr:MULTISPECIES: hypothetical protein [unclassified Legionella]MDI9818131.1 hypothetical protein [Legionella sp. PL877]
MAGIQKHIEQLEKKFEGAPERKSFLTSIYILNQLLPNEDCRRIVEKEIPLDGGKEMGELISHIRNNLGRNKLDDTLALLQYLQTNLKLQETGGLEPYKADIEQAIGIIDRTIQGANNREDRDYSAASILAAGAILPVFITFMVNPLAGLIVLGGAAIIVSILAYAEHRDLKQSRANIVNETLSEVQKSFQPRIDRPRSLLGAMSIFSQDRPSEVEEPSQQLTSSCLNE